MISKYPDCTAPVSPPRPTIANLLWIRACSSAALDALSSGSNVGITEAGTGAGIVGITGTACNAPSGG